MEYDVGMHSAGTLFRRSIWAVAGEDGMAERVGFGPLNAEPNF